jgi:DNA polymerase bacteriophage-type
VPVLVWDIETRSTVRLETVGAWHYAAAPATEILCVGFAVDNAEPQIWTPGDPIPAAFLAARDPNWIIVAHNFEFERAIATRILTPRYGWPEIPITQQRCTMAMALSNALPGALDNAAAALQLPFQKDADGVRLMRKMALPRRARKGEDLKQIHWHDGPELRARLHQYCKHDVKIERALFQRLPPLSPAEQPVWTLDAIVNMRGFYIDIALAKAARDITTKEQAAINAEIATLTNGEIVTVGQVAKIKTFVERNGHTLSGLTKRSVSAVLARNPGEDVRRVLELRREGARASTRKLDRLFACVDADSRLRGTLRFHAASTGRWSGRQFQPQNLKRPETADLDGAIDAALDLERIRALGAPLTVTGDVSRSIICAAPGHKLIAGDFSAIESRVLAWLANEEWKLANYRKFDNTNDPQLEPYCATASRMLHRTVTPDDDAGRQIGKTGDLALGFGGSLGAWRRINPDDPRSDGEILQNVTEWRQAHATTVRFWRALERTAHRSIRASQPAALANVSFTTENGTLYMVLPSGRRLAYPEARLVPGKFDGTREILFKDNAKGGWADRGAWYGTLVENLVQATARDLLAAAMLRIEAAGYSIVLTVHDEVVAEVPEGFGSEVQFLALLTTLPGWAAGLPIAAKVRSGKRYAKSGGKGATAAEATQPPVSILRVAAVPSEAEKCASELPSGSDSEHNPETTVSLADAISTPITDGKVCCPFHDDHTPSCHIYDDHYHCFVCGAHGDAIDWLMMVEGMTREQALERLADGPQVPIVQQEDDEEARRACALRVWDAARPIAGTLAARYLSEIRGIDLDELPADIDHVLRFHPHCLFGFGARHPCLIALMRNATTDAPTGIHRIALTPEGHKVERRMLGCAGAVKLWPAGSTLVVGEGIETVLAAATRIPYHGAPLQPAWALLNEGALGRFRTLPSIERLIILVDNDLNGIGQAAANTCAERWRRAGRTVIRLTPKRADTDFNDLIMREAAI